MDLASHVFRKGDIVPKIVLADRRSFGEGLPVFAVLHFLVPYEELYAEEEQDISEECADGIVEKIVDIEYPKACEELYCL